MDREKESGMRWVGITVAVLGVGLAIALGSNPQTFVDVPGILFVVFVGLGVILAGHGIGGISSVPLAISGSEEDKAQAQTVLETSIDAFVAVGWLGVLIGGIQMLGGTNDPTTVGAGMATVLLTAFYGYIAAYVVCLPLSKALAS
jgi:hypothetical protein